MKRFLLSLLFSSVGAVALAHDCRFVVSGSGSDADQLRAEARALADARNNFRRECKRARCAICPKVPATLHESFADPVNDTWHATAGARGFASRCEIETDSCR